MFALRRIWVAYNFASGQRDIARQPPVSDPSALRSAEGTKWNDDRNRWPVAGSSQKLAEGGPDVVFLMVEVATQIWAAEIAMNIFSDFRDTQYICHILYIYIFVGSTNQGSHGAIHFCTQSDHSSCGVTRRRGSHLVATVASHLVTGCHRMSLAKPSHLAGLTAMINQRIFDDFCRHRKSSEIPTVYCLDVKICI